MQAYITPQTVANQARMRNPKDKTKTRVFIEGDDDYRIFQNLISADGCILIPSTGKTNALGAVQLLRKEGWKGVIALVDKDFDELSGVDVSGPDSVVTDEHDAELMIIRSPALQKLLVEHDLGNTADDLRRDLLNAARPVGYLRWISIQKNLRLNFDDLTFEEFVDTKTLEVSLDQCLEAVIRNTRGCRVNRGALEAELRAKLGGSHDLWHVCCGHDVVALLAIHVGLHCNLRVHPPMMARSLRLAFEFSHFKLTRLYAAITEWEQRNAGWRILRTA